MCNFKHLPWINRGHYWAPPWAAWCDHWSTGNVYHSPIQCSWAQCALITSWYHPNPLANIQFFNYHRIQFEIYFGVGVSYTIPNDHIILVKLLIWTVQNHSLKISLRGRNRSNRQDWAGLHCVMYTGARVCAFLLCSFYAVTLCQAQEGPAPSLS